MVSRFVNDDVKNSVRHTYSLDIDAVHNNADTRCLNIHAVYVNCYSAGEGKMFSPGNLRATFDNPEYEKLISYWVGEKYTLRYTGGMVPDVFQASS